MKRTDPAPPSAQGSEHFFIEESPDWSVLLEKSALTPALEFSTPVVGIDWLMEGFRSLICLA